MFVGRAPLTEANDPCALPRGTTPGTKNAKSVKSREARGSSWISSITITSPLIMPFSVLSATIWASTVTDSVT